MTEKLREMQANGEINIMKTKIIAVSAITENQFRKAEKHSLFDDFSKIYFQF
jgi:hypothetical protein